LSVQLKRTNSRISRKNRYDDPDNDHETEITFLPTHFLQRSGNGWNISIGLLVERHLQEREIDLLLLAPEGLDPDRRKEFELHLSACAECRELVSFLRDIYEELKSHADATNNQVEEFISRLRDRERVIKLTPFRFIPDPAEFGDRVMTVLAAQSEWKNEYQYSSVCTLVSKDERALVRILKDNDRQSYRLFLMARDRPASSRATVRFPALGFTVTIQPDSAQADIKLPSEIQEIDWTSIAAELRFSQV
jgi:hypothetical protein